MRVLLANRVGRILLIAFTNHALDHLLGSVLDAEITNKIVRLGSRSNDERISPFSLENLEKIGPISTASRISINRAYGARKKAEKELITVLQELQGGQVSDSDRKEYMELYRPGHRAELWDPPEWIRQVRLSEAGWTKAGHRDTQEPQSEYDFWAACGDLEWLKDQLDARETKRKNTVNKFAALPMEEVDDLEDDDMLSESGISEESPVTEDEEDMLRNYFLHQAGLTDLPSLPSSDRPLDELLEDPSVWLMSSQERSRLDRSLTEETRQYFFERKKNSFGYLKTKFEEAQVAYEESQSQV